MIGMLKKLKQIIIVIFKKIEKYIIQSALKIRIVKKLKGI